MAEPAHECAVPMVYDPHGIHPPAPSGPVGGWWRCRDCRQVWRIGRGYGGRPSWQPAPLATRWVRITRWWLRTDPLTPAIARRRGSRRWYAATACAVAWFIAGLFGYRVPLGTLVILVLAVNASWYDGWRAGHRTPLARKDPPCANPPDSSPPSSSSPKS